MKLNKKTKNLLALLEPVLQVEMLIGLNTHQPKHMLRQAIKLLIQIWLDFLDKAGYKLFNGNYH